MTAVFLRTMEHPIKGATIEENLHRAAHNTGNYFFEEALGRQLTNVQEVFQLHDIPINAELLIMSMSNFLSPTTDLWDFADALEKSRVQKTVMVGAGAQAPDYTHQLRLAKGTERFLSILSERSTTIGVRGHYTAEVLERHGIHNVEVIGCPSVFWHGTDNLHVPNPTSGPLRTAFHYTPHGEFRDNITRLNTIGFEQDSFYIAQNEKDVISTITNPGSSEIEFMFRFYHGGDISAASLRDYFARRSRIFFYIDEWIDFLRSNCDFVFGGRFHGNMAGIQGGVPSLNLVSDSRTRELCEYFHLPFLFLKDIDESTTFTNLVDATDFSVFNRSYPAHLAAYVDFLDRNSVSHTLKRPSLPEPSIRSNVALRNFRSLLGASPKADYEAFAPQVVETALKMLAPDKTPEQRKASESRKRTNEGKIRQEIASPLHGPSPLNNFLASSRGRSINEIFADLEEINLEWQPDIYVKALQTALRTGARTVVDLGCGAGNKLVRDIASAGVDTIGIDFHVSLSAAKSQFPMGDWRECDLTDWTQLANLFSQLPTDEPCVFVVSDVIEHLTDPRPLFANVRSALLRNPKSRAVVSTPDRDRLTSGREGPPKNRAHLREWSLSELEQFFVRSGFVLEAAQNARSSSADVRHATSLLILSASQDNYIRLLNRIGLASEKVIPKRMILTNEHHGLSPAGGIGTYVEGQLLAYEPGSTIVMVDDGKKGIERPPGLVAPSDLIDVTKLARASHEDLFWYAAEQVLFFIPDLASIHYQEYQGIGARVAQAKRSGLLPSSCRTVVHCHGGALYIQHADRRWLGFSHHGIAEKEKISIELSDTVVFLSQFLERFYNECGYRIAAKQVARIPTPFAFDEPIPVNYKTLDTLVFVGKRSVMKGFPAFLEGILEKRAELKALGISRVMILARASKSADEEQGERLAALREHFVLDDHRELDRHGVLEKLKEAAPSAAVVLPYVADNYPLVVYEALACGLLPIISSTGGTGEMLPKLPSLEAFRLETSSPQHLLKAIESLCRLSPEERASMFKHTFAAVRDRSEASRAMLRDLDRPVEEVARPKASLSVGVPFFNTDRRFISDLVHGLNCQVQPPQEVIFVDDGSGPESSKELEAVLTSEAHFPYRILRHDTNKGLSSARNSALAATDSDILVNLDSDDVPLPNFLRDIRIAFELNPQAAVAVPYLVGFPDGEEFNTSPLPSHYQYRPVGEGLIASLVENIAGHANCGVRVTAAREIGGWNDSTRAQWEDYEFFLKVLTRGARIAVIPKEGCLYRVRINSMARTYDKWDAADRVSMTDIGLPRYETIRLYGYLQRARLDSRQLATVTQEVGSLRQRLKKLEQERASLRSKIGKLNRSEAIRAWRGIAGGLENHPIAQKAVRSSALGMFKLAKAAASIFGGNKKKRGKKSLARKSN